MTIPHWLTMAIETYGYWAILCAVMIESTGVPFPGETALLAGAIYAGATDRISIAGVIAAAAVGAIIGDNFGYAIGRYGGYPLIRKIISILHIDSRTLTYAQRFFDLHGDKTVFIGRFFALLRTWAALLAGVNQMRWRRFLFWNALGGIIWAFVFGLLGYFLGNNINLLDDVLRIFGIGGIIGFIAFAIIVIILWLRYRRRDEERKLAAIAESPDTTIAPTTEDRNAEDRQPEPGKSDD
ncbi:MAG: DedA protein [Ktedonobacterales bacterium]|nr:MAG: DedA protein [Ktedonobacterales bacterium]